MITIIALGLSQVVVCKPERKAVSWKKNIVRILHVSKLKIGCTFHNNVNLKKSIVCNSALFWGKKNTKKHQSINTFCKYFMVNIKEILSTASIRLHYV
jgi:hypothetical protein